MPSRFIVAAKAALRRIALRFRMGRPWAEVADVLTRCGRGELSAATALSRLVVIYRNVELLRRALARSNAGTLAAGARDLSRLLETQGAGIAQTIAAIVDDDGAPASSLEDGLERYRRRFDKAVQANEGASVALYTLGDESLLAAATEEAVELMVSLGVATARRDLLDLGCGIGRFEAALSPRVGSITGIDISPAMVAAARRRCARIANVRLLETSGRDLNMFANCSFDSVIAIDLIPYLYEVGDRPFVLAQLEEVARVLRPGGDLLILELSHRGDLGLDRADAECFAAGLGFQLLRNGTSDVKLWPGKTFHMRKPGAAL